jgi:hypothetical protein
MLTEQLNSILVPIRVKDYNVFFCKASLLNMAEIIGMVCPTPQTWRIGWLSRFFFKKERNCDHGHRNDFANGYSCLVLAETKLSWALECMGSPWVVKTGATGVWRAVVVAS